MTAIPYLHPKLYHLLLLVCHGRNLSRRYKTIAREIGHNKSVFDLGCGIGLLAKCLHRSCTYIGWDLNKRFIRYVRRNGRNVDLRDVFDSANYPQNDVSVIVDVLHHIVPKERILIKAILKKTKKLIVVEPYEAFPFPLPEPILKFFDAIFGDGDGINPYYHRVKWHYSKVELQEYFRELGANKIEELGMDIMAIFGQD